MPNSGSLTVSVDHNPFLDANIPYAVTLDWTSDASLGTVSQPMAATLKAQFAAMGRPVYPQPNVLQGKYRSCEIIPGRYGDRATNCPTGAYNVYIYDAYGDDILSGMGLNQSASVANIIAITGLQLIINSELTLSVTGPGNSKQGRIILSFEDAGYAKL